MFELRSNSYSFVIALILLTKGTSSKKENIGKKQQTTTTKSDKNDDTPIEIINWIEITTFTL